MELGRFRLVGHGRLALERGRGVEELVEVKAQRTGCTKSCWRSPGSGWGEKWIWKS